MDLINTAIDPQRRMSAFFLHSSEGVAGQKEEPLDNAHSKNYDTTFPVNCRKLVIGSHWDPHLTKRALVQILVSLDTKSRDRNMLRSPVLF